MRTLKKYISKLFTLRKICIAGNIKNCIRTPEPSGRENLNWETIALRPFWGEVEKPEFRSCSLMRALCHMGSESTVQGVIIYIRFSRHIIRGGYKLHIFWVSMRRFILYVQEVVTHFI